MGRQALPLLLCLEVSPKIPMNHFVCLVTPFIFEQTLCLLLMTKKWLLPSLGRSSFCRQRVCVVADGAAAGWAPELGKQKVIVSNCSLFLQMSKSVLCIADETFMCHTVGVAAHRSLIPTCYMPLHLILWTLRLCWSDWSWGIKVRLLNPCF